MGLVQTEITLKNAGDITLAKVGYIKQDQIRKNLAHHSNIYFHAAC